MSGNHSVIGISTLDDYVFLADAGLAMAMVTAGAERLIDLRGETKPPRFAIPVEHFPIMDLEPNQEEIIVRAARQLAAHAAAGTKVGLYCQAGISRTSTVAIAYLMIGGASLEAAMKQVRSVRPQAMPALELYHSLERIEEMLAADADGAEPEQVA